eukprot:2242503-Lingulodinium_polyedra.AAC.1
MNRTRCFSVGLNKATMVWLGPQSPEAIRDDFMSIWGEVVAMDGDAYAGLDDPDAVHLYKKHLAARRGLFSDPAG